MNALTIFPHGQHPATSVRSQIPDSMILTRVDGVMNSNISLKSFYLQIVLVGIFD